MTRGELPPQVPAFAESVQDFDIHARCTAEVNSAITEFRQQAERGGDLPYDPRVVAGVLESAVVQAVAAEPPLVQPADQASRASPSLVSPNSRLAPVVDEILAGPYLSEVEARLKELVSMPSIPTRSVVRGCFAALMGGSVYARDVLCGLLEAERLVVPERKAYTLPGDPDAAKADHGHLLREVIAQCEAHGLDARPWIDAFAATRNWHWSLRIGHLGALVERPGGDTYQPDLNATAIEITDASLYDHASRYNYIHEALRRATNPEVRQRLVNYLLTLKPPKPFSEDDFSNLLMVGHMILEDPLLSRNPTVVRQIGDRIKRYNEGLRRTGTIEQPYETARKRMAWDLHAYAWTDLGVDSLIQVIKRAVRRLPPPELKPGEALTPEARIQHEAEQMLHAYALRYADKGDYQATRKCLDAIESPEQQKATLRALMNKVQTPEQLEAVTPPKDSPVFDYEVRLMLSFEKLWVTRPQKVQEFCQAGERAAAKIRNGATSVKLFHIQQFHKALLGYNEAVGLSFARQVLERYREAGLPYDELLPFSESLIARGDLEEARRAYHDIHAALLDPSARLEALARLASTFPA